MREMLRGHGGDAGYNSKAPPRLNSQGRWNLTAQKNFQTGRVLGIHPALLIGNGYQFTQEIHLPWHVATAGFFSVGSFVSTTERIC